MRGFEAGSQAAGIRFKVFVLRVVMHENPMEVLGGLLGGGVSPEEKEEVDAICRYHGERIRAGTGTFEVFMKPLYVRRARTVAGKLEVDKVRLLYPTLKEVLARKPSCERLRDMMRNKRVLRLKVEGLR